MLDFSASMSDWSGAVGALRLRGFPFNPKFQKFRNRDKWYRIFGKRLKKIWELLNFKKVSHPSENSGNSNAIKNFRK